jgi:GntR family transcriptional regulator
MNINSDWDDNQPIYRQLRDFIVTMILDGSLPEGGALPSVRHTAAKFGMSPLTALKSYQQLVGEGLIESRRGLGMFVLPGARKLSRAAERERFLQEEWPRVLDMIGRLGLNPEDLLKGAPQKSEPEAIKPQSSPKEN